MKRTLTLLAAGTALAAGPALAGSMEQPAPEQPIAPAAPVANTGPDWTGFFGGAELGYANVDTNVANTDGEDIIGGLTFGYDHDFGDWVFGAGFDYDWTDVALTPGVSVDNIFRARLRGGMKMGDGLVYGTGGYANADTSGFGDDDGYFIGAGYEHMLTQNFSVGGEVLYHSFDDFNSTTTDLEATTAQVRGTFRF